MADDTTKAIRPAAKVLRKHGRRTGEADDVKAEAVEKGGKDGKTRAAYSVRD
jgi:hypothetical protein